MTDSILNVTVSVFKDYNTPDHPHSVPLLALLNSPKYADRVAAIRAEPDKKVRDAMKAKLPAYTPSGTFSYRSENGLIAHSRMMQFDIDLQDNLHILNYDSLKGQICNIENVAYCGRSVSGTGLWGLVRIAHPERHREHFDFLHHQFQHFGINIDKKPRNVAALRGYSFDKEAYFNHHARPLEQYLQPPHSKAHQANHRNYLRSAAPTYTGDATNQQVDYLVRVIQNKKLDLTTSYADWLLFGLAFAHEFGERGRDYFHAVSAFYPGYCPQETDRQFDKCLRARPTSQPITIKSFFARCKEAGLWLPTQRTSKPLPINNQPCKPSQPLQLASRDMQSYGSQCATGQEFNHLIMALFVTKTGRAYDVLFDKDGEWIKPGEQADHVRRLGEFFGKDFHPALFDGNACLVHYRPSTHFSDSN